jgi:hypothetical protein
MRQHPGSVICQPVPHSLPGRAQFEPECPCSHTGWRCVPSGAVAAVSAAPAVHFSTSFTSEPTRFANTAAVSLAGCPRRKKSAQSCPFEVEPNASGGPLCPRVSGDGGAQPGRPNGAPEGCGVGKAARTRTTLEPRPNRNVHRPSAGKRNAPRHAPARRLKGIGYWLRVGETATIRLQAPVAGTATLTRSPTRGAFELTLIAGGAGASVAATPDAAAASNAKTPVQRLTSPI